ncbi:MAG: hypothetical protein JSS54_18835 [Proteobacteria bacterium]|nr:hypothetical protein [Pseudomonadota bacterium]MBS0271015.1 hypothetical protein [Pseudomonadota bacterium]
MNWLAMINGKRIVLGLICFSKFTAGALAQAAQQEIQISATVQSSCTINGASTGVIDTATIGVNASGNVIVSPITPANAPYVNVVCNGPATLQLRSTQGAVKNAATGSGFANIINYQAAATWNGQTATIDTATIPTATGQETGIAEPVSAGSGNLNVTITPEANSQPLIGGNYSDSLFVLLTPQ